ncbi:MAG: hypothetical protein US75_C0011G0019 [Candidatus Woesebacteria bacterium GW2011_GWC1_38_13]|uniref:DUF5659 domain-containing protein n=3 Tax=Candidatus Woeseibacteriota TaxID=1752722 RepID=A0A0G0NAA4_9BACT|nr:MAG: hypothetical protein US67_C0061G0004 [Candidatus Woesebacteria bacterium GW2011_GWD1_38_10]KKQ56002.1 MAG: hypothetical protein US75_C0011G0019 [Candidatus Woesebacteria bacterium GW2011_GWC1_38_13]KKQ82829.1 MAG: hypothetical protein UT06_C0035G0018 [Candidatus Woesebacteria bacterium GW2011_GWA1_38_8]
MTRLNEYRTKDIYLASFISLSGKLLRLERESDFYWFVFENKIMCEEIVSNYWQGESKVEARAFVNAIKGLKTRVFSGDN